MAKNPMAGKGPMRYSDKVKSATDSVMSRDVDNFDRGGYPGEKHVDMQSTSPVSVISKFAELGESLKRNQKLRDVAEQISQISELAEQQIVESGEDWFDQHTIKRNMKELKSYAKEFEKISEDIDSLNSRACALYDDMGNVLTRYFELAPDQTGEEGPNPIEEEYDDEARAIRTLKTPKAYARVPNENDMTHDQALELLKKEMNIREGGMNPAEKENAFHNIVKKRQHAKVDGVAVDLTTAAAVVKVLQAMSPSQKAYLLKQPVPTIVKFTWKVVK